MGDWFGVRVGEGERNWIGIDRRSRGLLREQEERFSSFPPCRSALLSLHLSCAHAHTRRARAISPSDPISTLDPGVGPVLSGPPTRPNFSLSVLLFFSGFRSWAISLGPFTLGLGPGLAREGTARKRRELQSCCTAKKKWGAPLAHRRSSASLPRCATRRSGGPKHHRMVTLRLSLISSAQLGAQVASPSDGLGAQAHRGRGRTRAGVGFQLSSHRAGYAARPTSAMVLCITPVRNAGLLELERIRPSCQGPRLQEALALIPLFQTSICSVAPSPSHH